ncbi:MAG: beta-L-arabinofuranosidase domain-containing protein [Fusicatenibacter sp.]
MILKTLDYQNLRITDSYLDNSFHLESTYLLSLDADRLLAGFQETAGLRPKAIRYGGWEVTEIQGHTLGHYMTALAQAWGATHDPIYMERIAYLMEQLEKCQRTDGYLFASPEELFDRVENRKPVWVPWYTMDKILQGLSAIFHHTQSQKALAILCRLGNWISNRVLAWSEETKNTVLSVEYGGMNGALYEIYHLTGDYKYAKAAHQFDEMPLFEAMYKKEDILNGLHANTTIPKILGGLKGYLYGAQSDEFYLIMAENFWDMVVEHHTYITGGNSEWEHFGMPDVLDAERTACNCETCNTYNMLKLTGLLFRITKEKKYADYDEQTFYNAILSSQNSQTGMTTYFQPMATGYFKVYSTPYDKFWCCTGTGMENFTKQSENICFAGERQLYINRLISSEILWEEAKLRLKLDVNLLKEEPLVLTITEAPNQGSHCEILVRQPAWLKEVPEPVISGKITVLEKQGYFAFDGLWKKGDRVTIPLPMKLAVHGLPDNPRTAAFTYGPFVLSAYLGTEDQETTVTGVDVTVPARHKIYPECILLPGIDKKEWEADIASYLKKADDGIRFVMDNQAGNLLTFEPHFLKNDERYGIYFQVFDHDDTEYEDYKRDQERRQRLLESQFDVIPVGNDQYELAHKIGGSKTDTTVLLGRRGRIVREDGWFSYEMTVPSVRCGLCVTYAAEDAGKPIGITLNEEPFVIDKPEGSGDAFFDKTYELPATVENTTVTVKFHNEDHDKACRIFDELYIRELGDHEK